MATSGDYHEFIDDSDIPTGKTLELLWEDDFQGTELDPEKWVWLPNEFERSGGVWYDPSAMYLDSEGHLVNAFTLREGTKYTGAWLKTAGDYTDGLPNLFEHSIGYWAFRYKLPTKEGWVAGVYIDDYTATETVDGSGTDGTELDLIEYTAKYLGVSTPNRIPTTLHYDRPVPYNPNHPIENKTITPDGAQDGWHVLSVLWLPPPNAEYIFYHDGVEYHRTNFGGVSRVNQHWIIEGIPSSSHGDYTTLTPIDGPQPSEGVLLDYMLIDWVRVYNLVNSTTSLAEVLSAVTISDSDIETKAAEPERVTTDEGTIKERSVDELIKAQQHASNQSAPDGPLHGLRVSRFKPAGPV